MDTTQTAAFWGALGALAYAAGLLITCLADRSENPEHRPWVCIARFLVSVMTGTVLAAAGAPWFADMQHITGQRSLNMLATFIGLTANSAAPVAVAFAPRIAQNILESFKGVRG